MTRHCASMILHGFRPILAATVVVGLGGMWSATTVHAADVQAAITTLAEIGSDKTKLAAYCAASAELFSAQPEKTEEMAEKFDATVRAFGPQFAAALDLHYDLDDAAPDGIAMVEQFAKLDALCAK
ncbi:MAG: hypothetical protein K2Y05_02005 [Hyphomicrobiaceae bacterium]|nr:hypothetical protein [Hyphomicrobiaceae bacterium]